MATATDIGAMISRSPEIRGGQPRIAGSGVTVMRRAGWHQLRCSPEEIARKTSLSLAQIHAALAYYYAIQETIDADLANEGAEYERSMTGWQATIVPVDSLRPRCLYQQLPLVRTAHAAILRSTSGYSSATLISVFAALLGLRRPCSRKERT